MAGRLVDYMGSGLASALPTAATVDGDLTTGAAGFYYATDTSVLYSLNRSGTPAWETVGRGWVEITHWEHAVSGDTANIDVTDLDAYSELMIIGRLTTTSVAANRMVRCSVNNGASYYSTSGEYVIMAAAGTESNDSGLFGLSTGSASARSFSIRIQAINVPGSPKISITPSNLVGILVASYDPVNAIRVLPTAGNLTGGEIWVLGK